LHAIVEMQGKKEKGKNAPFFNVIQEKKESRSAALGKTVWNVFALETRKRKSKAHTKLPLEKKGEPPHKSRPRGKKKETQRALLVVWKKKKGKSVTLIFKGIPGVGMRIYPRRARARRSRYERGRKGGGRGGRSFVLR